MIEVVNRIDIVFVSLFLINQNVMNKLNVSLAQETVIQLKISIILAILKLIEQVPSVTSQIKGLYNVSTRSPSVTQRGVVLRQMVAI